MRLNGALVRTVADKCIFDNTVSFFKTLVYITKMPLHTRIHVAGVFVPFFGMEQRSAFGQGFARIKNRRQRFVLHLDQLDGFFSCGFVLSHNGRHFIAHITHALAGQDFFIVPGRAHAVADVRHVGSRDHSKHTRQRFGCTGVDAFDQAVGNGAAQDFAVRHVGQTQIGSVFGAPSHLVRAVIARNATAHGTVVAFLIAFVVGRRCGIEINAFKTLPVLHGLDDARVGSATTQVAAQGGFHVVVTRSRLLLEQLQTRHHHARCTEPTLQSAVLDERLLQRMQIVAVSHAFDGFDLGTISRSGQHQTRRDRATVHEHRAGAAVTRIAATLGTGQVQFLTQDFLERGFGSHTDGVDASVDGQLDQQGFVHELGPSARSAARARARWVSTATTSRR